MFWIKENLFKFAVLGILIVMVVVFSVLLTKMKPTAQSELKASETLDNIHYGAATQDRTLIELD